jgi:hypothetical protein
MKGDLLVLDLAVLAVTLVSAEDDRDVIADAHNVTMPARNITVCNTIRHVKHDDSGLSLVVVGVSKTSELFLKYLSGDTSAAAAQNKWKRKIHTCPDVSQQLN